VERVFELSLSVFDSFEVALMTSIALEFDAMAR
jgi:hypothetical protein